MSLPSKTGLTGLRETDMLILQQLRDDELDPVCEVNAYLKSICDDPIFWYNRINNKTRRAMLNYKQIFPERYKQIFPERYSAQNDTIPNSQIELNKNFYGFKTLKELSRFIDQIPELARFHVFYQHDSFSSDINKSYFFDPLLLPKYINLQEIIFELRREMVKVRYEYTNDRRFISPRIYLAVDTPGYRTLRDSSAFTVDTFDKLKKLGIKF